MGQPLSLRRKDWRLDKNSPMLWGPGWRLGGGQRSTASSHLCLWVWSRHPECRLRPSAPPVKRWREHTLKTLVNLSVIIWLAFSFCILLLEVAIWNERSEDKNYVGGINWKQFCTFLNCPLQFTSFKRMFFVLHRQSRIMLDFECGSSSSWSCAPSLCCFWTGMEADPGPQ